MIVTEQKPLEELLASLKDYKRIFLLGCGECATTCNTGGEKEVILMRKELEKQGKVIVGSCIPNAPCVAAQTKVELAKQMKALGEAEAVLVLACGLGVQSVKDNERLGLSVLPACNSLFGAVIDSKGNFYEKCSMCAECVLDFTQGICPITLCPKGLLNGPCGGMNKGKCEVDPQKDCTWVLIYNALEKKQKLHRLKEIQKPKDHKKSARPHTLIVH